MDTVAHDAMEGGRPRRQLLRSELRLMARRRRNLVGLATLCLIPVLIAIVLAVVRPTQGESFFSVLLGNGLFVVLATLAIEMTMMLPLAVSILSGDSIAGEANIGTLRYLLTTPVGRTRLLVVKFASLVIGAIVGVLAVSLVAAVLGLALFGAGDFVTVSGVPIGFGDAAVRIGLVAVYVALCLVPVCAIGLFASTMTEQPIGAAIATAMFGIISQILGNISALDWLHPFLLTNYWPAWTDLLRVPMAFDSLGKGLISMACYTAIFGTAAWARFTTRDITS
jgi:ABC-2 type transport system permease protein